MIGIAKLAFDMQQNEIGTFDFKQNIWALTEEI